jgi:hypothetical protein
MGMTSSDVNTDRCCNHQGYRSCCFQKFSDDKSVDQQRLLSIAAGVVTFIFTTNIELNSLALE